MKILVTGFEPFGGECINPAFEAVKLLPKVISGAEIVVELMPVVFRKCGDVLRKAVVFHSPGAVLCVGQAGGRSGITVEKVAINLAEGRIPDNDGQLLLGEAIQANGPAAYFSNLPVKAMVRNIKAQGIPASISYTAGTYVCNNIFYHLLYMIDRDFPHMRGGFIHVPFDTSQALNRPDGTPTMPVATVAKALEQAIEAIVLHKEDIQEAAGITP